MFSDILSISMIIPSAGATFTPKGHLYFHTIQMNDIFLDLRKISKSMCLCLSVQLGLTLENIC